MAGGKLFQNLINVAKQVAAPSLMSGGLTTGMSLITGSDPLTALAYGVGDTIASGGSVAAVRALRPKSYQPKRVKNLETGKIETQTKGSRLELPANIAASIGTGYGLSSILEPRPNIGNYSQEQQIGFQLAERAALNDLSYQAVAPGTQFQLAGLPSPDNFQRLLNQQNNWSQYLSPEDQAIIQQTLAA